jgi:ankyrin repeat protein
MLYPSYAIFFRFGCTPLHQAAYFRRITCCQTLLNAGAWVDVQESWGRTPLFLAIEKKNM